MDSPSRLRNPSPPPEIQENLDLLGAESIGNTAFSKHWLFTTLMKLIEEVDRENEEEEAEFAVDVDEELQNELCKLWDMSMNSEVAQFLQEFKAVEILTGIVGKAKAPRVTEICVGILGNMACDENICQHIAKSHKLINLMLILFETRDAPTLVEVTRLVYTSLSNPKARGPWTSALKRSEDILDHLMFIFGSSTNCDLLRNTAEMVDTLLDLEENFCVSWATTEFVQSLLEAVHQIGYSHSEALEIFLHIFQLFSTSEPGVEALISCAEPLHRALLKYLNLICEYEIVGIEGREQCLASALSVLNILFTSVELCSKDLLKDEQMVRIFLKVLEPLYPQLKYYEENVPEKTAGSSDRNTSNSCAQELKVENQQEKCSVATSQTESKLQEKDSHVTSAQLITDQEDSHMNIVDSITEQQDSHTTSAQPITEQQDSHVTSTQHSNKVNKNGHVTIVDQCGSSKADVRPSKSNTGTGNNVTTANRSDAEEYRQLKLLYGIVSGFLVDYWKLIVAMQGEDQETESESAVDCDAILQYLDEGCSRCRLNYMILTMNSENGKNKYILDFLLKLCDKHNKSRLHRIINDVLAGRIVKRAESSRKSESSDS